ncbi:MAG TPA: hypothetical protein PKM41_00290 [Deltaproteobacteria bacterium]|jgi:hypothetical protein|nr:hypothetical protein [Deltaproteobacteria bacterium]HOI06017.1 hypothetical protein [Deltaproteobacteria bacterium]
MINQSQRSLLLRVGFIVNVIIGAKTITHLAGWELFSINPLFSGIVAANVFLMGFLLLPIRDLDNPLGCYERSSGGDVSLKPVGDLVGRLDMAQGAPMDASLKGAG